MSSKNNNIKIAHLSVRSLKNREHLIQVKDTVTSNNFDVFTIPETWLDDTVSDLEVEILAMIFIELIAKIREVEEYALTYGTVSRLRLSAKFLEYRTLISTSCG